MQGPESLDFPLIHLNGCNFGPRLLDKKKYLSFNKFSITLFLTFLLWYNNNELPSFVLLVLKKCCQMGFPSSLESEITKFKGVYFQAPIPKPFGAYYTN